MKTFLIEIDIYHTDIAVNFGDVDELINWMGKHNVTDKEIEIFEDSLTSNLKGITMNLECGTIVLFIKDLPETPKYKDFLAHEIFHAACMIMQNKGITLDTSSEEAFAYLIGNITRKIHEKLDKINNK